ncbi:hypothetical protein [Halorubrum sp. BV1]|uniref:DUF7289 family protein n=1 Tax=Halorubrum sp. BV1 TaxID=1498500 RepID=UPI0006785EFF|nr:hypothetical protein [Halorubrum sp. BV1]
MSGEARCRGRGDGDPRGAPTITVADGGFAGLAADDRGVSNVVGYVLVFSLVTVTIGTVFTVGLAGVEDRQDAARLANVERAFEVLDDNVRDIQRYDDPSRSTEIRMNGGRLAVAEPTTVWIENGSGGSITGPITTRPIEYTSGDTTIAYEAGALFRSDSGGTAVLSDPPFVAAAGETVLPVVRLFRVPGAATAGGDGTVQIEASTPNDGGLARLDATDDPREIRVASPRAPAWGRYFERTAGFEDVSANETVASATITENQTVYVRRIAIDVALRV